MAATRNPRPAPIPARPDSIAAILEPALAACPDALALADAKQRYTYRQLDIEVGRIAARLVALGVRIGTIIACSLPNGCPIVMAFLASQRIGAVWVGINQILPGEGKAALLIHSQAAVLLADAETLMQLAGIHFPDLRHRVEIDDPEGWPTVEPTPFTPPPIDPHALAAINYTSGTTGEPKGIMHSQHSLVLPVTSMVAHGMLGPSLRRGVVLPLTITNVMVTSPLLAFAGLGACLIGPGAKAAVLVPWIRREGIEVMSVVPAITYDLANAEPPPASLKMLGSGGAPLSAASAERIGQRLGLAVTNTYGLTEAPTIVTQTDGRSDIPHGTSGQALPHLRVTIRGDDGAELPVGETGEICIEPIPEGPWAQVYSLPLGYWRDEARTVELHSRPWLPTGDVGRIDANGWLFVSDRKSDLILRGGSNVYPQEIVRVLEQVAGVAAAAVIGVPDERMGEITLAFIQLADGSTGTGPLLERLTARCAEVLPSYKHPDRWFFRTELPRNPGGKIVNAELRKLANIMPASPKA